MLSSAPLAERSHSGLVRRFAKPLKGVSSSEGSNPSLSAIAVSRVPVAQWIERQVADLKVGGSSPLGHASPRHDQLLRLDSLPFAAVTRSSTALRARKTDRYDSADGPSSPARTCQPLRAGT